MDFANAAPGVYQRAKSRNVRRYFGLSYQNFFQLLFLVLHGIAAAPQPLCDRATQLLEAVDLGARDEEPGADGADAKPDEQTDHHLGHPGPGPVVPDLKNQIGVD